MPLYLPKPVTLQPQRGTAVNWNNPISKSLVVAWTASNRLRNIANNAALTDPNPGFLSSPALSSGIGYAPLNSSTGNSGITLCDMSQISTSTASLTMIYKKLDSTNRNSDAFTGGSGATQFHAHVPYGDGIVHFDFGSNRVSYSGGTFREDVWTFQSTPQRLEIWQNGILRSSGSTPATRSSTTGNFLMLGTFTDWAAVSLVYIHNRGLTANEVTSLHARPFQLFEPNGVTVVPQSITYTYARPASDVTTQWTPSSGTLHYALINETTPNDANYIYATAAGQTDEVGLQAMSTPAAGTSLTINYRVIGVTGTGASVTTSLYSGATLVKADTARTTDGTYAMTVTSAEWGAVSVDWSNMRLRFVSA